MLQLELSPRAAATVEVPVATPHGRGATVPQSQPLFNVVLIDDDEHTYDYVIEMLVKVFGRSVEESFELAREVDHQGRVIVETTHQERAELKRDQILGFGADPRLLRSHGSMGARIEPAP